MSEIYKKLELIQKNLKAPKNQFNKFGGYKYRSCEDILEAIKPLLDGCVLIISDEIVEIGGRIYVKATACMADGSNTITNTAYAREAETKKGMDESQITGAASSYARKYALNGLFCIDDTKDADTFNDHCKSDNISKKQKVTPKMPEKFSEDYDNFSLDILQSKSQYDIKIIMDKVKASKLLVIEKQKLRDMATIRYHEITGIK